MANPKRFRNFSFYTQGKRWGTARTATLEIAEEGGGDIYDKGVWIGTQTGVIHSQLTVESFVPVGGLREQKQALNTLMSGRLLDVTCGEIGGQFMKFRQMKPRNVRYEMDSARATLVMSFVLTAGAPDVLEATPELPWRVARF